MTAVVGIVDSEKRRVWIGADSYGTAGGITQRRADPKVFKVGKFLFGMCGSFRMGNLLRYNFKPTLPKNVKNLDKYMNTTFINAVRKCFKEGGYLRKISEREEGGPFIVGVKDRLFSIHTDFQVASYLQEYEAMGAGWEVCLGSLYSTADTSHPPEIRIRMALEAASEFCTTVGKPFTIMHT